MGLADLRLWFDVLFGAVIMSAALLGLTAAGHFPRRDRLERIKTGLGSAILWTSILMTCGATAVVIWSASRTVAWSESVISASLGLLLAPMILQYFPDRFVDGRRGLIVWSALCVGLTAWIVARS